MPNTPSALDDVSRWAARLDCRGEVRQTYNDVRRSNLVWHGCRDDSKVELMSVQDGEHAWWTNATDGFNTAAYILKWFDTLWQEKQTRQRLHRGA